MVDASAVKRPREPAGIRLGLAISDWTERWFPDAFVFALVGIVVVFVAGLLLGRSPAQMTRYFGGGFWTLIPFTMQMALIVIFGYVVASSPPVYRLVQWLATIPKTPRTAVAWIALFASVSSLLSWGFSLVFSGLLVREVVRRVPQTDYRAAGAAGYLGLGSVWALGLSSSAALLMATKGSIPASLLPISGVLPLSRTIFLWQSIVAAVVLMAVSVLVPYLAAAAVSRGRHAIRPRDCGRAHPVPVLCGNLRHDHRHRERPVADLTVARRAVRPRLGHEQLSHPGVDLLGRARCVRALGREQMGHRSALSASGRERAEGEPRLGRADLQRRGGPAEPRQPVLDAAAPRAAGRARTRPRRLRGRAAPRAPPGGPVLDRKST